MTFFNENTSEPCGCGSCEDAIKAALRHYNTMGPNDCPIYHLRVAAALYTMAAMSFKNWAIEGITGYNVAAEAGKEVASLDKLLIAAVAQDADDHYRGLSDAILKMMITEDMVNKIHAASKGQYRAEEVKAH